MLLDELTVLGPAMGSAVHREDWEKLAESCHRLAGASEYCGMPKLHGLASSLEQAALTPEIQRIQRIHHDLQTLVGRLLRT
jgi:HPt (histidine-containing phosphotransfer) domain-containing protein